MKILFSDKDTVLVLPEGSVRVKAYVPEFVLVK